MLIDALITTRVRAMITGALLAFAASSVHAIPALTFDGSGDVTSVTGMVVGGHTYTATWSIGSFNAVGQNPTVLSTLSDATSLVDQIRTLFNANPIAPLGVAGVCTDSNTNDCDLVVAYNVGISTFDAVNVDWNQPGGPWINQNQTWGRSADFGIRVAQVTLTETRQNVPEPTTLAILALGLACLRVARRGKK